MTNIITVVGISATLLTNRVEQLRPPQPGGSIVTNKTVHHTVIRSLSVTCNWDGQVFVLHTNATVGSYRKEFRGEMKWIEEPTFGIQP